MPQDNNSKQLESIVNKERLNPADHGNVYQVSFSYKNETGGTLAAGTKIGLAQLPAGAVAIHGLSQAKHSALGASRTLDIGHEAYKDKDNADVAEKLDLLLDGANVSGAGTVSLNLQGPAYKAESKEGIVITAQVNGGTIPANATIDGVILFSRA